MAKTIKLYTKSRLAKLSKEKILKLVEEDALDVKQTLSNSTGLGSKPKGPTFKEIIEARPESEHEEFRILWGEVSGF